jgi:voltage-gated potassium channel
VLPRRLVVLVLIPLVLLALGTVGYRALEGPNWTLLDALYMTAITLTTVGFGEVHPLSPAGKVFTIGLCLGGIFAITYAVTEVLRVILTGELNALLGKRRMERGLADLRDHLIVCGYGRMGRQVCREFDAAKLPYVVIERDDRRLTEFAGEGFYLPGDATEDDTLKNAGVERARGLITLAATDADNLYVALSARLLNDKLLIVARAETAVAEAKLLRVGANHVILPYVLSGARVAQAVMRPTVMDFIELATRHDYMELQIEEIRLDSASRLVGQTLARANLRRDLGVIVVAIKRAAGAMVSNPTGEVALEADDTLICLGHRQQLDELERLAGK